ncbi:hypothetical protein [Methylorubrum extorquens]|uniref:Uncharacterized protein n=1 Tax=Methylorubrum extorquens TaxID=408 RepID=A0AAX3WLR9_METEX|nr:hypothetical protein [Methylorubrum extorquens]WHQ72548.1 hypothetical protein KEC54_13835 [Methylorubrum extorquens]
MNAALALTDSAHLVASWRAGVLSLPDDQVPCPGMIWRSPGEGGREGVWRHVRKAMLVFLDEWGEHAADLGWSTEALFGVHRGAGALRSDSTGALVSLYPRRCIALCEREIHLERRGSITVDRGLTNPADSVPLWLFAAVQKRIAHNTLRQSI